jgi:hypothetical protein
MPPFLIDMTEPVMLPRSERDHFVFFAGSIKPWLPSYSRGVRQYIAEHFSSRPDWYVFKRTEALSPTMRANYLDHMRRSLFCLCPEGLFAFTPRVVEAILSGCIPVVFSERIDHPFASSAVPYASIVVHIPASAIAELPSRLAALSPEDVARRLRAIGDAAPALLYHSPPAAGDALYRALDELAG